MTLKSKRRKPKWTIPVSFELIFWIAAMILLAMAQPARHTEHTHFSLCPLANMGFSWCPGCGLGRSITHVFHGNFRESFDYHWFGLPAILIIGYRIITLGKYDWKRYR